MMMLQILKSVGFTKTQKSRYLKNEKLIFVQTLFFCFMAKNSFVAEVTFQFKLKYLIYF